jgi:hypothetical protein
MLFGSPGRIAELFIQRNENIQTGNGEPILHYQIAEDQQLAHRCHRCFRDNNFLSIP